MDNFKNELQLFSPKLYLIAIVVGVTIGTCILFNLLVGAKTEAEVWRQTSIQAIVEANKQSVINRGHVEAQKSVSERLDQLKTDLANLNDLKVDEILEKYFKQGK